MKTDGASGSHMTRRSKLAWRMPGLLLLAGMVTGCWPAEPGAAPPGSATLDASVSACTPLVNAWPVSRRVEQLLMVAGQFSELGASKPMAAAGVGGFVLFGQPAAGSGPTIGSGIAALDASASAHGQIVPWMSTDEEGGPIARLSKVIGTLPSPRQMAAEWTPTQVRSAMTIHGSAMKSLGVTMDLAPVLDTASPPTRWPAKATGPLARTVGWPPATASPTPRGCELPGSYRWRSTFPAWGTPAPTPTTDRPPIPPLAARDR